MDSVQSSDGTMSCWCHDVIVVRVEKRVKTALCTQQQLQEITGKLGLYAEELIYGDVGPWCFPYSSSFNSVFIMLVQRIKKRNDEKD